MKKLFSLIFVQFFCISLLAQTPYLSKVVIEECESHIDSEIEYINVRTFFESRVVSKTLIDSTLILRVSVRAGCGEDEGNAVIIGDTIYLQHTENTYPLYTIDSLGKIVESKEDKNQIYCICFYQMIYHIKNVTRTNYIVKLDKELLPETFTPKFRFLSQFGNRTYYPADKPFFKKKERLQQYDEKGQRQGKHLVDWGESTRYIAYFKNDVLISRVRYNYIPKANEKNEPETKNFTCRCQVWIETFYYPNGKKKQETKFNTNGSIYLQTRWNQAGKAVFLKTEQYTVDETK